jgi:TldD protein
MYKDLADFSIEYLQKKGAEYAEARLETNETSRFILNDGNPEISSFDDYSGIGVRFSVNKNIGFVSINNLEKNKIRNLLDKSFRLTERSARIADKIDFAEAKAYTSKCKIHQKINIEDLGPDKKLKILNDLNKDLSSEHKYLSLSDKLTKKYYVNTEGSKIYSEIPRVNFFYFLTINEAGKTIQRYLQYGATGGYELINKWELEKNIESEIKALKDNLKNGVKAPMGEIDVILAPEVTGIAVHESGGHPYEADRILGREAAQAGESFIKEKMIGHKIANEQVTIVDDPTLDGSYGFFDYDDEGVKGRRKYMVKDGKIVEFMHDRSSAAAMNLESNGSARATRFSFEPLVRMSNTFLLPGKYSEDEMIKDVKKGIYFKNFMEWNIDDKRYQQKYVGNEAYLIENGEITKPVRNPALEITTPVLWSSIDAVGNNSAMFSGTCGKGEPMQGIPVWMGGPSVRLRNVIIS